MSLREDARRERRGKKLSIEEEQQLCIDSLRLVEYAWNDNDLMAKCSVLCRGLSPKSKRKVHGQRRTTNIFVIAILFIVAGCSCQLPHECISVIDRGCLDLVSLAEYIFGLLIALPWAMKKNRLCIDLKYHLVLALLGLSYAFLSNLAMGYRIPTSLFVSLKNGILLANLLIGRVFMQKKYSFGQQVAVLILTLGLIFTFHKAKTLTNYSEKYHEFDPYLPAVISLLLALLSRAASAAVQEKALESKSHTASAVELIFMRNLLGLPFFFFRARALSTHFYFWLQPTNQYRSILWSLLLTNLCFDYACKILMTKLVASRGALFASLILSIQKFIAFCLSVIFVNPILRTSKTIWASACLVLLGTAGYAWASNSSKIQHSDKTQLYTRTNQSLHHDASSPSRSSSFFEAPHSRKKHRQPSTPPRTTTSIRDNTSENDSDAVLWKKQR